MSNFPQKSVLELITKVGADNKNIIDKVFFTPPFKIIQPLEYGDFAEIMLLCVSAGLMKDDTQEIHLRIGEKSKILLSTQSYEKIHNTQDGKAQRNTQIVVEKDAFLRYSPLPCIPFENSSFEAHTNVFLHEDCRFYYDEIFCAGRVAIGETFAFKQFASKIAPYAQNNLIFFENMRLIPAQMPLQSLCMFYHHTHLLSYIIFDKSIDKEALKAKVLDSKLNAGISSHGDVILIKALANESEILLDFKESLLK